jgi:adenylate kinase family enzyme
VRRPDDEPETVKKRLDLFESSTRPVLEYYRKQNASVVHDVHCVTSPEGYEKIKPILNELAKRQ